MRIPAMRACVCREEVYLPHTQVLTLGDMNSSLYAYIDLSFAHLFPLSLSCESQFSPWSIPRYVTEAGELEIIDHVGRAKIVKNGHTFGEVQADIPNIDERPVSSSECPDRCGPGVVPVTCELCNDRQKSSLY